MIIHSKAPEVVSELEADWAEGFVRDREYKWDATVAHEGAPIELTRSRVEPSTPEIESAPTAGVLAVVQLAEADFRAYRGVTPDQPNRT